MALEFNGSGQRVEVGNDASLNPSVITICLWLKSPNVAFPAVSGAVTKRLAYDWLLRSSVGSNYFALYTEFYGSGLYDNVFTAFLPVGTDITEWHHYGFTYDATQFRTYLDGTEFGSGITGPGGLIYSGDTGIVQIANQDGYSRHLPGTMFDVRIYDTVLSSPEMNSIASSYGLDSITSGLVGRWQMNEKGPGQPASVAWSILDTSLNSNNGNPIGIPIYRGDPVPLITGRPRINRFNRIYEMEFSAQS